MRTQDTRIENDRQDIQPDGDPMNAKNGGVRRTRTEVRLLGRKHASLC